MKCLLVLLILASLAGPLQASDPAAPLDQNILTRMTAPELQTEFDSTIALARSAQERYHKTRGRRLITSLIPGVGAIAAGETAARTGNLRAYQVKLLQLKRELRGRFPAAWEATKKKWLIEDNYLER